ncbi:MAG: acyltransferase [Agriterribacter sp.]
MTDERRLEHIKSLDGIRGIAVLLVVFFHCPFNAFKIQFGWVGVNLFLILSGFLITRILISNKTADIKAWLPAFYIRRWLKIVPLYYFYLFFIFFFLFALNKYFPGDNVNIAQGLSDLKRNLAYLLSFTYNFGSVIHFFSNTDYHNSVFTGHLWSISVEQQFYLLFPVLVYYLPAKYVKRICFSLILFIPFLRLLTVIFLKAKFNDLFWIGDVLYSSTLFQSDAISIGVCIALCNPDFLCRYGMRCLKIALLLVSVIGVVHIIYLHDYGMSFSSLGFDIPVYHLIYQTPYTIFNNRYFYSIPLLNITAGLIFFLVVKKHIMAGFLTNRLLTRIGKISYSIYIWHLLLSYLTSVIVAAIYKRPEEIHVMYQVLLLGLYLAVLFLISQVSYVYIEMRFLRLKHKYPYKPWSAQQGSI